MIFYAIRVYDIVIDGNKPAQNATTAEHESYETPSSHALRILIQVISPSILIKV